MKSIRPKSSAPPASRVAAPADATLKDRQADVFEALGMALKALEPGAAGAMRKRVLARVESAIAADGAITTVKANPEGWAELLPKVHAKRIFTDGQAEAWLVRLDPGGRAPAHDHPGSEECLVLEGSIRYVGGSQLSAGDFEVVQAGAHHSELVSDAGALVYLRYSMPLSGYLQL